MPPEDEFTDHTDLPTFSLHIPIAPNKIFYSNVKWLRKSLDRLGSPYSESRLYITISNDGKRTLEQILSENLEFQRHADRYFLELVDPILFKEFSYGETAGLRYRTDSNAEVFLLCDADVFFVRRFDELLLRVAKHGGIYGVLAHFSPFIDLQDSTDWWWERLSTIYCGEVITRPYRHRLTPELRCPAYYNNGFVIGGRSDWQKISNFAYQNFRDLLKLLPSKYLTRTDCPKFYCMQISLALALHTYSIETEPISEIYNCANDPELIDTTSFAISDIRVIHYLRKRLYSREQIFLSEEATSKFLDLAPVDSVSDLLQATVRAILQEQGYD